MFGVHSRFVAGAVFLVAALVASPALAVQVISFGRQATQPDTEAFGGTAVTVSDAVDLDSGAVVGNEITGNGYTNDLTAYHQLSNGDIFSADTFMFSFPDVGTVNPGDVVKWDGSEYSILFSNTNFVGAGNVNGFSILPNGHFLLTTKAGANLPGIGAFADGDIVEWDPDANAGTGTGSLFLAESEIFTAGANNSVDAIHLLDAGTLIFSVATDGTGELGSNNLDYSEDSSDLFSIDLGTKVVTRILDGENLWDSTNTRQTDAVFVPEPATALLLALGLTGLAARRRSNA